MARSLRIEYEGARYHVMSRGDRREAIYKDEEDRESFLKTLGQTCEKTGWQVHAYCQDAENPNPNDKSLDFRPSPHGKPQLFVRPPR